MFRLFQYYFKLIIKTICDPSCSPSCSRRMATRRSTWARCSITERTPLVQVKHIFHKMELEFGFWNSINGEISPSSGADDDISWTEKFHARSWHTYFWLNLQELVSSLQKKKCEIEVIHRPADIYEGNGASWEAVPSNEKPLVRVRKEDDIESIYELFFFCPKFLLSRI